MSVRDWCDCGRLVERWTVELSAGGRVELVGCPACTQASELAAALDEIRRAILPTESKGDAP